MKFMFGKKLAALALAAFFALALFSCQNDIPSSELVLRDESAGIGNYFFPDATAIRSQKKSYIYYGGNGQSCGFLDTYYLKGWESVPFVTIEDACSMISLFNDRGWKVSVEDGVYKYNYNQENIPEGASWPTDWNPEWLLNDAMYFDPKTQTVWSDEFVRVISSTSVVNNGIGGDAVTAMSKASAKNPKI